MAVSDYHYYVLGKSPTESRARGERRPVATWRNIGGKNRPFSTEGFTDTRSVLGPNLPNDTSIAGSYVDYDLDNYANGAPSMLENVIDAIAGGMPRNQTERRSQRQQRDRMEYNMAQGPGSSSSRPKYPTNARDNVREGAQMLKKVLGKRKERREGGTPKDNRK